MVGVNNNVGGLSGPKATVAAGGINASQKASAVTGDTNRLIEGLSGSTHAFRAMGQAINA